jgi:hypothetical protein
MRSAGHRRPGRQPRDGVRHDQPHQGRQLRRAGGTRIFGVSSTIKVYLNGARKLTATNSLHPANHKQGWKKFVLTFRATSDRTTISFLNGDPRTDNSNGLDAVSLA